MLLVLLSLLSAVEARVYDFPANAIYSEEDKGAVEDALGSFASILETSPCPESDLEPVVESLADLVDRAASNVSICDCLLGPVADYVYSPHGDGWRAYGSTVTLLDGDGQAICAPYAYWAGDDYMISTNELMDPSYRINEQPWLREPVDTGKAVWSDPYFDEGGGNIEMVTYSLPLLANGSVIAVATTDMVVTSAARAVNGKVVAGVVTLAWMASQLLA